MKRESSPYSGLSDKNFWRTGVAAKHISEWDDIFQPKFEILQSDSIVTAGSCFAQHVARYLRAAGCNTLDGEPLPSRISDRCAVANGFRMYSARYGNIYTPRQLKQLILEYNGTLEPAEPVWESAGRFFDSQRPSIEPNGMESENGIVVSRKQHLSAVQRTFSRADIFVFTLGLTETWEHIETGTVYPTAPGTIAGVFDQSRYSFRNLTFNETYEDFSEARRLLREKREDMRFLLTVSPVPLTATATDKHVLAATTYSKSVLRAVAGQLADEDPLTDYFPSYEMIATPPSAGFFYAANQRDVTDLGVATVMEKFLAAYGLEDVSSRDAETKIDPVCDEMLLEAFARDGELAESKT